MPLDLTRQLVTRWTDPQPAHIDILKQAGIEGVVLEKPDAAFQQAAQQAGIQTATADVLKGTVSKGALWPGVRTPAKRGDDETASASSEPWLDANAWLVGYEKALNGGKPPVLSYLPDKEAGLDKDRYVAFETLEVGLIEARLSGGNYVLALEPRYREALLKGDAKATTAWTSLGRTAKWLNDNRKYFGLPARPQITVLVDRSDSSGELALLAYRRGANPRLVAATAIPAPNPDQILVIVAANLEKHDAAFQKKLLAHAEAGSIVVTDWKPDRLGKEIKKQEDRVFYQMGKGQLVVYNDAVIDPSEFSLDVIDLITYRKRPSRLWNALATIPLATDGPGPGEVLLQAINYGQPTRDEVQARVLGHFGAATYMAPGSEPKTLKTYRRGELTEVFMPKVERAAIVHFRKA